MRQEYSKYTEEDQLVWKTLFDRQAKNLAEKGSARYMTALETIKPALNGEAIPCFKELSAFLLERTGWQIEVVPGLIPVEEFFELLAERKFSASTWLRKMSQLDYLEEPDMFHDIFGHVPLLSDEKFARFMQQFGELGMKADPQRVIELQRLYWYTIEFGIMRERGERKVYGAGICSSFGETNNCMSPELSVKPFNLGDVFNRPFYTDEIQDLYFELDSFDQLFEEFEALLCEENSNELLNLKA